MAERRERSIQLERPIAAAAGGSMGVHDESGIGTPDAPRAPAAPAKAQRPTMSERVAADANEIIEVVDALGRRLGLRRIDILEQYDLVMALGEKALNQAWMNMFIPLLAIVQIDGEWLGVPQSYEQARARVKLLGEAGANEAMKFMTGASTDEELRERVKNS